MPVEQDFMRVLPLGWSNPLPCLAMITWSSCQSRPRVTRKVRYSVSTTALPMTLRSKVPSTVSLLVPPTGMITKESWLLGYNYPVHWLLEPRLEKSSTPGLLRCLPDVCRDLSYILLIMGFELIFFSGSDSLLRWLANLVYLFPSII